MNCTLCDGDGYIPVDVTGETEECEGLTCPRCDGAGALDPEWEQAGDASELEVKR